MQVLVFGAPWCASCKVLKKQLDSVKFDRFEIEHVDIETSPEIATRYGVKSLPTVVVPAAQISRAGITTLRQFTAILNSI